MVKKQDFLVCHSAWLISFRKLSATSLRDPFSAESCLLSHYVTDFIQKAVCNLIKWLLFCTKLSVITWPILYMKLSAVSLHDSFPTESCLQSHYMTHFLQTAVFNLITWLISYRKLSEISLHDSFPTESCLQSHYMTHFIQKAVCNLIIWLISYRKLSAISLHDSFPIESCL